VDREISIEGEIRTRIWYAANRNGIEFPFPVRNVFMTEVTQDQLQKERQRDFNERVSAIQGIEMFAPLEREDRELLARDMKRVGFAAGEQIIRQGDPGDSLYLIQAGEVAVRLSVEGAEREVAMLKRGQFFGEMSLMTGEPRRATCGARGDVDCYVIDHAAFKHLLDVRPEVLEVITRVLGERQTALEGERDNLSAEARARRAAETSSRLLNRIRDFFHLG
jgi:CRP-like cAMP-binding protein